MVYRLSHRRIAGSRFDGRRRLCGQLTHPGLQAATLDLPGERAGGVGNHDATYDRFIQRVAEILGIESETVGSAFATAQHELADEQFATKMDTLVEDGTLTREQADAANAWFTARPADAGRIAYIAVGVADADKVAQILQKAVDNAALTQEQTDAISAWHGERPDFLPEHRIGHDRDGGRHHGGRGHDGDGDSSHAGDGDAGHAGITNHRPINTLACQPPLPLLGEGRFVILPSSASNQMQSV